VNGFKYREAVLMVAPVESAYHVFVLQDQYLSMAEIRRFYAAV
jgi:hypothetical protein